MNWYCVLGVTGLVMAVLLVVTFLHEVTAPDAPFAALPFSMVLFCPGTSLLALGVGVLVDVVLREALK